jgi:transcriptional regulator with XRE-family HTH domain
MRGDRLAHIREKRGFTQVELAEALGLGQNQIWRYENNKTEPDAETVARIARYLEVSADYLLGLVDYPDPYIEGELTQLERTAIAAWRHGDRMGAIRVIVGDE